MFSLVKLVLALAVVSAAAEMPCNFTAVDKETGRSFFYDLSPLRHSATASDMQYGPDGYGNTFYVNVCGDSTYFGSQCANNAVCNQPRNLKIFGCGLSTSQAFYPIDTTYSTIDKGVTLRYVNGDACSGGPNRSTTIRVICSDDRPGQFVSAEEGNCAYTLTLKSVYGCGQPVPFPGPHDGIVSSALHSEILDLIVDGSSTLMKRMSGVRGAMALTKSTLGDNGAFVATTTGVVWAGDETEKQRVLLPGVFASEVSASNSRLFWIEDGSLFWANLSLFESERLLPQKLQLADPVTNAVRGDAVDEDMFVFVEADGVVRLANVDDGESKEVSLPAECKTPDVVAYSQVSDVLVVSCSGSASVVAGLLEHMRETYTSWKLPQGATGVTGVEYAHDMLWVVDRSLGLLSAGSHEELKVVASAVKEIPYDVDF